MIDPRARLGLLIAVGIFAVLLDRPVSLGILAALTFGGLLALPIGRAWRRRAVGMVLAVIWGTMVSQGLFYADLPRTPWARLGPLVIWQEGLVHGLVQSLRMVATTSAGVALAVSTPADRLFAGLVALRVPYGVAFLAVTALRFVPVVGRELWIAREARARRGRPPWARSPWAWLRLEMALLIPVAARSLRRARALAETLDTRGFDPSVPRRLRRPLRLSAADVGILGALYGALLALVCAEALYQAYLAEILYLPGLRPLYAFVRAWL